MNKLLIYIFDFFSLGFAGRGIASWHARYAYTFESLAVFKISSYIFLNIVSS